MLALALGWPADARAGTARLDGSTLAYVAADGEADDLVVAYEPGAAGGAGAYTFTAAAPSEPGAGEAPGGEGPPASQDAAVAGEPQPGPGCRPGAGPRAVICPAFGVRAVAIVLRDEDDHAVVRTALPAVAAIDGGVGNDRLEDTSLALPDGATYPLRLAGGAGNDVLAGYANAGGDGNDRILVPCGAPSRSDGGPGDDAIVLGATPCAAGGAADGEADGGEGDDRLTGGPGRDVLRGGPGRDVVRGGPGRDLLSGGAGRDRLLARDGARDRVSGGPGRDRARVDRRLDRLRTVERRG